MSEEPIQEEMEDATPAEDAVAEETTAPSRKTQKMNGFWWGTGRRKSSVARVRIREGEGQITVNDKDFKDYFPNSQDQNQVSAPLSATETVKKVDIFVRTHGGGTSGQSGAIKMGLARALCAMDESLETALRDGGLLTRDSRMKERKKYGQRGARRRFQFSKR